MDFIVFSHEVVNHPPAVVWGHGSSVSIHKYMLAQARQLQELSDPGLLYHLCTLTLLQSLQDEFLHRFWPTHNTMALERQAKQDKGLQGCICEELGLMVSPFCYGGHMVSYDRTTPMLSYRLIADERSEYYAVNASDWIHHG